MRLAIPLFLVGVFAFALFVPFEPLAADDKPKTADQQIAALEGGKPLPEGAMDIQFPWIGKQSIMCIGDSVERQIAFVDFSSEDVDSLGTVQVAADGSASGAFTVRAADLKTGHVYRDKKLLGGAWLDAESHPELKLVAKSMTRVKPTVWKIDGQWNMHGVAKTVTFYANVRWIGEMQRVGKTVVRVKGGFRIDLKDFNINNDSVGTAAVARYWDVDVVLLGVSVKK